MRGGGGRGAELVAAVRPSLGSARTGCEATGGESERNSRWRLSSRCQARGRRGDDSRAASAVSRRGARRRRPAGVARVRRRAQCGFRRAGQEPRRGAERFQGVPGGGLASLIRRCRRSHSPYSPAEAGHSSNGQVLPAGSARAAAKYARASAGPARSPGRRARVFQARTGSGGQRASARSSSVFARGAVRSAPRRRRGGDGEVEKWDAGVVPSSGGEEPAELRVGGNVVALSGARRAAAAGSWRRTRGTRPHRRGEGADEAVALLHGRWRRRFWQDGGRGQVGRAGDGFHLVGGRRCRSASRAAARESFPAPAVRQPLQDREHGALAPRTPAGGSRMRASRSTLTVSSCPSGSRAAPPTLTPSQRDPPTIGAG